MGDGGPAGGVHLPPDHLHLPQPEEPAQDHQWQASIVKFRVLQFTNRRPLPFYEADPGTKIQNEDTVRIQTRRLLFKLRNLLSKSCKLRLKQPYSKHVSWLLRTFQSKQ